MLYPAICMNILLVSFSKLLPRVNISPAKRRLMVMKRGGFFTMKRAGRFLAGLAVLAFTAASAVSALPGVGCGGRGAEGAHSYFSGRVIPGSTFFFFCTASRDSTPTSRFAWPLPSTA